MPKDKMKNLLQTAVHESGHILTCYLDPICKDDIHKVSIVTRGNSRSKSYKLQNDHVQGTKEEMISMLDFSLGGMFAEEIYFSSSEKIGTGCGNGDLQKATNIAKSMIKELGMSADVFGFQVIQDQSEQVSHKISEKTRNKLDTHVIEIINKRSGIVKRNLEENSDKLKVIIKNLIEYEELTKKELEDIIDGKVLQGKIKKNHEIMNLI
jgi:cell division protease FtsH